jgi:flagellar protein FliL
MRKLLPVLLALLGIGGGVGAGFLLKPDLPPEVASLDSANPCGEPVKAEATAIAQPDPSNQEYVKLSNQFIVPIVLNERVNSLVVLSLSVEVGMGQTQIVFDREPKLRDAFLQVLFNHANIGGFKGVFTESANMMILRRALKEAGQSILGDAVSDILITDLARQDV